MAKSSKKIQVKRTPCPISGSLDLVGDKWSLLIIRDLLFFGKDTYNAFLASEEKIATNILNDRLNRLTELGFISHTGADKRKKYALTPMGMDLKPLLEAMARFGLKYIDGSEEYVKKQYSNAAKGKNA